MIVSCEKCQARYLVASLLLGKGGRKVKCGVCGHSWFQEPEDEAYNAGDAGKSFQDHLDDEGLEPIPEGVRPIPEGSSVPVAAASSRRPLNVRALLGREDVRGWLAAAAVFVLVLGSMVAVRGPLVQAWPPSTLIFKAIGMDVPAPGDGLVFDRVTAKAKQGQDGNYALTLEGNIINLKKTSSTIPAILATLQNSDDANDAGIGSIPVALSKKVAGPEETVPFTATYGKVPTDAKNVRIRFVLK